MRGARLLIRSLLLRPGIIPADAGSTKDKALNAQLPADHPRGCGEHTSTAIYCPYTIRIIPADAGST